MAFNCLKKSLMRYRCHQYYVKKSYSSEVATALKSEETKTKLTQKDSFMKNVFIAKVDKDLLCFPELETSQEDYDRIINKASQLESKAMVVQQTDTFSKYLKSGICSLGFQQIYGGTPTNLSYLLNEADKLDLPPVTSFLIETQYSLIIESISKYGTELQKQKYLKDLITGEVVGAYALHEEMAGSDPSSLQSIAIQKEPSDNSPYVLNGEKTWIANADKAQLFIVFAKFQESNRINDNNLLTAFIVDKDTPGISLTKHENIASDFELFRVKFDNVTVPNDSVLAGIGDGYSVAVTNLESPKVIFNSTILSLLRKLLSEVTMRVSKSDRYPIPLRDNELVQHRLSKITSMIYALESSLYHFTGISDKFEMDTSFESVIVQNLFCTYGSNAFDECISIAGTQASNFETLSRSELSLLFRSFAAPDVLKLYIALKGLEFSGKAIADLIKKSRNPLDFPGFTFKRMLNSRRQMNDSPKLTEQLYLEYHPTLKVCADNLEYCVFRLKYCVETMFVHHGTEIVKRQTDLVRLSEIASDIFSMIAVLGRASRSYCTGIRYHDQEVATANAWCLETTKKVKTTVAEIIEGRANYRDHIVLRLAPDVFQHKGYFFANPLEKNIM